MTDIVQELRAVWKWDHDIKAADEIDRLRKTLCFAAGYISAMPDHSHSPPDEILAWLEHSALEGK
jgi:hypothetical protein